MTIGARAWLSGLLLLATIGQAQTPTKVRFPDCGPKPKHSTSLNWGKYGVRFFINSKELKKANYKIVKVTDIDYRDYRLYAPPEWKSKLEIWWQVNNQTRDRKDAAEPGVVQLYSQDGEGFDNRGISTDGTRWRIFVFGMSGAEYKGVTESQAAIFDHIIDSACEIPYTYK